MTILESNTNDSTTIVGDTTIGRSGSSDSLTVNTDGANFTTSGTNAAVSVTQSSTGNILDLKDGSTTVASFLDGGDVLVQGANADGFKIRRLSEVLTLTGATTDTTIEIPAGALVLWAMVRVTTAVVTSGATNTFDYGIVGDLTRYGDDIAGALGTTNAGVDSGLLGRYYLAATKIRFDGPGAETFSSGAVRVSILCLVPQVATS